MGRLVLTGTLLVTVLGVAHAGPKRKVQVESDPPGATVYLNDVDSGPVCEATPCTISAPIGVSTIILRLDNYEPEISELDVPKGKRPLQQTYKLKSATGILVVEGPRGAVIRVDEVDRGRAPLRLQVTAEAHHVVIVMNGKSVYDDYIEVATGEEVPVRPKLASADDDPPTITDDDEGGGGGGGGNGASKITGSADGAARMAFISAGVAFDVGFRHFEYDGAMTQNLRKESEVGQVIAGPAIELWPGRLVGVSLLRGLSLYARMQFPIAGQRVEEDDKKVDKDLMGTVTARWSSYEASLRQRWTFGSFGVEVSGGFVQDQFTFDTTVGSDIALMPDTRYQSLRLGGKLSYVADSVEPYISGENRIVTSGGPVGERFDDSRTSGVRGSAGIAMRFGSFFARAEGTLMRYTWKFAYSPGDPSRAEGATDSIQLISMGLGYSY